MEWRIHNAAGYIHLITSVLAVASAVVILFSVKGTKRHKQVGYVYVACMVLLNVSAWGVMEFNKGKPGPFHFGALVSLLFIFLGMYPVWKRPQKWLLKHYYYINASAIGLFAAFFVEIAFRSFTSSLIIIGFTIGMSTLVALIGTYFILKYKKRFFPSATA